MNLEEISNGIKELGKVSIDIKSYYDNHEKLVEGLNKVPQDELDRCLEYYATKSGVIVDLRKELIDTLKHEGKITTETLSELLNKHKKGKENQFKSYKNWFSIFYPPITFYGHNSLREFINSFIDKFISDLSLKGQVKSTLIDFQGARQQGSDRLWIAIYNKEQKSQAQGIQFFIEFFNGNVVYGVYRHSTKSYLKAPEKINYLDFDYNQFLMYFMPETDIIRNDTAKNLDTLRGSSTKNENMNNSPTFFNQLITFIEQTKTDNLKTKHFINQYNGAAVRVSFGQGAKARVPWISFLVKPNTTSNGIYPVYLYFKDLGKLILAYGVSETNIPSTVWNIQNPITISHYFDNNNLGRPERYGASYIYKVYDADNLPAKGVIDNDLNKLIEFYLNKTNEMEIQTGNNVTFEKQKFLDCLSASGLQFDQLLITRFISSLTTKPFVILTGLSGSGKTKLAQAFAKWISKDIRQYRIIPIGADWTNREPILGFPNALNQNEYVKPDNGALDLIIQANLQPDLPYFMILDEMNLSHVERYFADFLSVMESKEEIPLHNGESQNGVPSKLRLPDNLFIIGTVNIDETTNMFSPKVLDRANTIEFRVTQEEMKGFLKNIKDINMELLTSKGKDMGKSFLKMSEDKSLISKDIEDIHMVLVQFFGELKKTGAEFGYRSAMEIMRLIYQLSMIDNALTTNQMIDIAIMQKLLPKLHGSRRKLSPVLETLARFCISGDIKIAKDVFENMDFDYQDSRVLYPISLEKIARMYRGATDNGFASFAEA